MKLVYWYAKNKKDSKRDLRERTKKLVRKKMGSNEVEFFHRRGLRLNTRMVLIF